MGYCKLCDAINALRHVCCHCLCRGRALQVHVPLHPTGNDSVCFVHAVLQFGPFHEASDDRTATLLAIRHAFIHFKYHLAHSEVGFALHRFPRERAMFPEPFQPRSSDERSDPD